MQLADTIIVVLRAAEGSLTIEQIVQECQQYFDFPLSHLEVKEICLALFQTKRVMLTTIEPLTFAWREPLD